MPTKDEILEKITEALVEALGVEEDEVTPEATLVGDLGAESIDFLDIVFRLEKAFDIKIPRGELFPEDVLTNAEYVADGRVTETGLAELRSLVRSEPTDPGDPGGQDERGDASTIAPPYVSTPATPDATDGELPTQRLADEVNGLLTLVKSRTPSGTTANPRNVLPHTAR